MLRRLRPLLLSISGSMEPQILKPKSYIPTRSASAASSKTTASNPLSSTPMTTPQRHPKKQRRVIFPFDSSGDTDSTAAASTLTASKTPLTASKTQRLLDLEAEVLLFLKSRKAIYTAADMGTMLAQVLTGMFPTQAHYTAALFQDYGYTSSNYPATPEEDSPPLSPLQLTTHPWYISI
jgi:hypothetical protein